MSAKIRVAINGFGRIGRNVLRVLMQHENIDVVAINDIAPIATMAHLLKYDSIHGITKAEINHHSEAIFYNQKEISYFSFAEINALPWGDLCVDFVIEATGKYKTYEKIYQHISSGAKRVILSAPPEDDRIKTVVLGVNEHILDTSDSIISNASCTTNNAAPMLKLLHENLEIQQAYITTVHSYTTDQSLHDQPHKDLRRARGAAQSIVPTTTGAAKALTRIFPELMGKLGGSGIRVPVPNGSLTDITCYVKTIKSAEEINLLFKNAAKNELQGILAYTEDPLVSVDIIGNPHSCIFDSQLTSVIDHMVKVVGWYDNEMGYSNRIVDLIEFYYKKIVI